MKHLHTFENIFDQFDTGDDLKVLRDIGAYVLTSQHYKLVSEHTNYVNFKPNVNVPYYYSVFINLDTFDLNFQIFNDTNNNPINYGTHKIKEFSDVELLISRLDPLLNLTTHHDNQEYYFLEMLYSKNKQKINWLYYINNTDISTEKIIENISDQIEQPIETFKKVPTDELFDIRYKIIKEKRYMVVLFASAVVPIKTIIGPKAQLKNAMIDSINRI